MAVPLLEEVNSILNFNISDQFKADLITERLKETGDAEFQLFCGYLFIRQLVGELFDE